MGFTDNQFVVTRHSDTEHEHVLVNRITMGGDVVSDSQLPTLLCRSSHAMQRSESSHLLKLPGRRRGRGDSFFAYANNLL